MKVQDYGKRLLSGALAATMALGLEGWKTCIFV